MDWDGVGTFAFFLSLGAVVVGVIALKAYTARLASKLEIARLRAPDSSAHEDLTEQVRFLEDRVHRLTERVDFTERLLGEGPGESADSGEAV